MINKVSRLLLTIFIIFLIITSFFVDTFTYENDFSIFKEKIIINELFPAPIDDEKEWIELYNNSDEKINLTGWKILDNTSDTIILSNIEIHPQDFFVFEPSPVKLNNSGDYITLLDSTNKIVDKIEYGEGTSVNVANSPNSIGKLPNSLQVVVFNNPTKGKTNSTTAYTMLEFSSVTKKYKFNPYLGEKLEVNITFSCPAPVTIKIFNQYGILVKTILDNKLVKVNEYSFTWDGADNFGKMEVGTYICKLIAFQNNQKKVQELIIKVYNDEKKKGCILTKLIKSKNILIFFIKVRDSILYNSNFWKKIISFYYGINKH